MKDRDQSEEAGKDNSQRHQSNAGSRRKLQRKQLNPQSYKRKTQPM